MSNAMADVAMKVLEGPLIFTDYEPRNLPGYESNIAAVLGKGAHETRHLLAAVDSFVEDQHYVVYRKPIGVAAPDASGKPGVQQYKVTITAA
jgi:hypothetical protein